MNFNAEAPIYGFFITLILTAVFYVYARWRWRK